MNKGTKMRKRCSTRPKSTASKTGDFTLGRRSFAKISALEDIHLSKKMERDFREFDRMGLSGEKRRRAIVVKYARKPLT